MGIAQIGERDIAALFIDFVIPLGINAVFAKLWSPNELRSNL